MEGWELIRNGVNLVMWTRGKISLLGLSPLSEIRVDQAVCDECLRALHFPKSWLLRLWTTLPTL